MRRDGLLTDSATGTVKKIYPWNKRESLIIMDRLDFYVKIIEIPPVRSSEIRQYIFLKIKNIYPGNTDNVSFEFRILPDGKNALLILAEDRIIEEYRLKYGKAKYILPLNILYNSDFKNTAAVLTGLNYYEIMVYGDEGLSDLFVLPDHEIKKPENRLISILKELSGISIKVLNMGDEISSDLSNIIRECSGQSTLSIDPFTEYFPKNINNEKGLFNINNESFFIRYRSYFYFFILLMLAVFSVERNKMIKMDILDQYEVNLEKRETVLTDQRNILKELEDIRGKIKTLEDKKKSNLFQVLSELEILFQNGISIENITINGDNIEITAVGVNPFSIVERFNANNNFSDVKIYQITPQSDNKEKFSLSCRIKR